MSKTKEKAPTHWHFTCQLTSIYENFKEQLLKSPESFFERVNSKTENSEYDSYDKNDMQEKKVKDLVRLDKATREKLKTASYSKQIQIITLVPDKWY